MLDEAQQILGRLQATMDFMLADEDAPHAMKPWLVWQSENILDHIGPEHFTPCEMVALVGLLGPIFSRVLGTPLTPPEGTGLRAVC